MNSIVSLFKSTKLIKNDAGELGELVRAAYVIFLGRNPEPQGYNHWLTLLQNGLSREQFIENIIASPEFAMRQQAFPQATAWMNSGLWGKLVQSDADITIPIQGLDFPGKRLFIQGPAADNSVFKLMIENSGLWEYHITRFISQNLLPGETFMDVGANLGYYTVLAADIVGEQGRVVSFEPLQVNCKYCKQNIIINSFNNVSFFNYGLWNEVTKKQITFPFAHHGQAQIIKDDRPEYASIRKETIQCTTLDSMMESGELELTRLDMIKMDIEGAEPYALEGMKKTLEQFRPKMVFEMNRLAMRAFNLDTEVIWDFFQDLDYELSVFPEYVKGLRFKKIREPDQLKKVCPADNLVDLVARPR